MVGVTAICYVVSETTVGNVSQVDRLWGFSLPPPPANAPPELSASYSPRAMLMLVLTVRQLRTGTTAILNAAQFVWSVRLHWNTYCRGFFNL